MATVRAATLDDASEVVRLAALMFASMGLDVSDPEWVRAAEREYRARLGGDLAAFVVDGGGGGRLVASGAGTVSTRLPGPNNPSAQVGYIQWVATDPEARRQGLGRAVMEALLDWYDAQHISVVELHATIDGEPLYRSLGFRDDGPIALRRRTSDL